MSVDGIVPSIAVTFLLVWIVQHLHLAKTTTTSATCLAIFHEYLTDFAKTLFTLKPIKMFPTDSNGVYDGENEKKNHKPGQNIAVNILITCMNCLSSFLHINLVCASKRKRQRHKIVNDGEDERKKEMGHS